MSGVLSTWKGWVTLILSVMVASAICGVLMMPFIIKLIAYIIIGWKLDEIHELIWGFIDGNG